MIRKDIALDTDRPHFYSQYWIDVAAGKHEGSPTSAMEADIDLDLDIAEPEPVPEVPLVKPVRVAKAKDESKKPEAARSALTSLQDLAQMMKTSAEMDADTIPDIEGAVNAPEQITDVIVTDFDPASIVPEAEEPAAAADQEFAGEDFEDEDEWGEDSDQPRRGSKPVKRQRREQRREF
jgi:hypothetical protein